MNFEITIIFIKVLFVFIFYLSFVPILVWGERRILAFIQDRLGPNRADIYGIKILGIVQVITDMTKFFMKEDFIPENAHKIYFNLAPFFIMVPALITFLVIPFADSLPLGVREITLQAADLNFGLIYILAIASLGVYGIILAGWSSNNKYSLLGAIRAASQFISYEVPMAFSVIGIIMVFGSVQLNEIVKEQGNLYWGIVLQPLGFLIFLISAFAETNRLPFDLPETDSELVAGYHLEYRGMKFGIFMISEYINMVVLCAIITTLFFGGWQVPFLTTHILYNYAGTVAKVLLIIFGILAILLGILRYFLTKGKRFYYGVKFTKITKIFINIQYGFSVFLIILGIVLISFAFIFIPTYLPYWAQIVTVVLTQFLAFLIKLSFFLFLFIWVRLTLPRFRYDQLMKINWKYLLPLSILNILITALVMFFLE